MSIRAVFWDLGGVLVRTKDPAPRRALAERLGMSREALEKLLFSSPAGLRAQRGEIGPEELWEQVRTALNLPPEEASIVRNAFWGGDRLDTDLVNFIRSLRPRYRTGVISNAWSNLRSVITERWKIADAFDTLVISAEVGLMKPDARIYRLALEKLEVAPAEAIFLDDFAENIEGAQAVGMHAIHFVQPEKALEELQQLLQNAVHLTRH